MTKNIAEKIGQIKEWIPAKIEDVNIIPKGDMPGDKVEIGPLHIDKAQIIFPNLLELLTPALEANPHQRAVVVVCGGSGVGKSEIASLLSYYLNEIGLVSYTLSGDNYPHRLPKFNDPERLRIFRNAGITQLIASGEYTSEVKTTLRELQEKQVDADQNLTTEYPWLSIYQEAGRTGLKDYLGTKNEIDFDVLNTIISQFKSGASDIFLKRMGREESELWYDLVDFTHKNILVIEWTHGNNDNLQGVDVPILLNSTPEETLAHRKSRNRDGGTDSPFISTVLELEQNLLIAQASKAKLILSKHGEILSYNDFTQLMMK